jgi:hypothetical protein
MEELCYGMHKHKNFFTTGRLNKFPQKELEQLVGPITMFLLAEVKIKVSL